MLLAVDIGNTAIHIGVFEQRRLRRRVSLPTRSARLPGRLRRSLGSLSSRRLRAGGHALVCSVVPWATAAVVRALRAAGVARVRVVGRTVRVPLKNRYRYPAQVGQDRLVGAYAAWKRFGRDCVVADFGTAITIDVVTKAGEYLGGVIAPGLEISLDALANRTALLPRVALREPPELLGRDTANSIRSGLLYGGVALCDGLITQLKRAYAPKAVVVATGGGSRLIAKHSATIDHLAPDLVLDGLQALSQPSSNP